MVLFATRYNNIHYSKHSLDVSQLKQYGQFKQMSSTTDPVFYPRKGIQATFAHSRIGFFYICDVLLHSINTGNIQERMVSSINTVRLKLGSFISELRMGAYQ